MSSFHVEHVLCADELKPPDAFEVPELICACLCLPVSPSRTTAIMRALVAVVAAVLVGSAVALDNGMGIVPPLGYSTWCSDGRCGLDYCSEVQVKEAAMAMITNGMFELGYNWVLLDDCWAAGARTANGSITWDTNRFPSGIPALTAWLHARSLKFGLYTSAGNTTCDRGGRPYPILGSEGHYQEDMNSFAAWNVDYVKVDWCGDVKKMPLDGIMVGAKDYKAVSAAITNTTPPRSMYLEGVAAYIFLLGEVSDYVNAWRASTDHHDDWDNTLEVLATVQLVGKPGAPGAWSDMDVLMTGGQGCRNRRHHHEFINNDTRHCPGMTDTEYVSEFTLWSLMQSPLVVATDIRNMTAIMNTILLNRRLVGIHQDTRTPPGKWVGGDKDCGALLGSVQCQYWRRILADGSVLLVLFNADSAAHTIDFSFAANAKHLPSGWSATTAATAEDVWLRTNSTVTGSYSATVASHGVSAVVLHPQS